MPSKPLIAAVAYPVGRAGSSALMGLLRLARFNAGTDQQLIGPSRINPKGFFELPAQEEFLRRVYAHIYPHFSVPPGMAFLDAVADEHSQQYLELLQVHLGERFPIAVKSQWFLTLPFLANLRSTFDVRVLTVERDLDDQIRSLLRVYHQQQTPVFRHATAALARGHVTAWKRFGEDLEKHYALPTLRVSFEDLTREPSRLMAEICSFLDQTCPPASEIESWIDPTLVNREELPSLYYSGPSAADAAGEHGPPAPGSLSFVVNTYNEERNIADLLKNIAGLADEIVVVDMESRDRTVEIARTFTDRIFSFPHAGIVEPARQFAIDKATSEWVFVIDADERISPELASSLRGVIGEPGNVDVFYVPRRNQIVGRWLQGTGWGTDVEKHPRLFKKGSLEWPARVHAQPKILGEKGPLPLGEAARIDHYNYDSLTTFIDRLNRYTTHELDSFSESGVPWSWQYMLRTARDELQSRYEPEADGVHSLVLAVCMGFYRFLSWAKLWERQGCPQAAIPATPGGLLAAFIDPSLEGPAQPSEAALPEPGKVQLQESTHQLTVEIELLRRQLAETSEQRDFLSEQVAAHRRQLESQQEQARANLGAVNQRLEEVSLQLEGVLRSRSWRVTAPLRKLMLLLRRPVVASGGNDSDETS